MPRRENVVFFDSAEAAERAGFRACRRCQPRIAGAFSPQTKLVLLVCKAIESAVTPPTLGELAVQVGLSPGRLQRLFKQTVGVSPKEFAAGRRTQRFRELLGRGVPVTQAIYRAGYSSNGRAYENVRRRLGVAPSEMQRGGAGLVIRYATTRTNLGWLLVAATERGICAVEFGDDRTELRSRIVELFPAAERIEGGAQITRWAAAAGRVVATGKSDRSLPLDIRGTAFQLLVWKALMDIPTGQTRTYQHVAAAIGAPRAARAVGRACGDNPTAVIIPCHRVARSDGGPGGYRWGLQRKRALLDSEATRTR